VDAWPKRPMRPIVGYVVRQHSTSGRGNHAMAKARKGALIGKLQSTARLSRTALASRLLKHGLYAGQDQIMLVLDAEDGLTPGRLAQRLGVRPPTITKTINRLQAQGFLAKQSSEADARQ